ncbi:hypothetical protein B5807_03267 [Epicoccum nigrum]|uniref:Uncharacterized protein n=1 Tax=Epicoccum nigrum TaxID=105696 RepID=A0A1Y2M7Z4_EPING|nr:hypothetical protein B5807_03267 [Epicoccum nigrum]
MQCILWLCYGFDNQFIFERWTNEPPDKMNVRQVVPGPADFEVLRRLDKEDS